MNRASGLKKDERNRPINAAWQHYYPDNIRS
ncbi:hypothetical protein QO004_005206 [Rhizobium mesoamericanum]|nr:hypothetical protein [Rhizobium mesoamericanum]